MLCLVLRIDLLSDGIGMLRSRRRRGLQRFLG